MIKIYFYTFMLIIIIKKIKKTFTFFYFLIIFYTHTNISSQNKSWILIKWINRMMHFRFVAANGAIRILLQEKYGPSCIPRIAPVSRNSRAWVQNE